METRIAETVRLVQRARAVVGIARRSVLRARALNIQAAHLAQQSKATRYENHLIRRMKR